MSNPRLGSRYRLEEQVGAGGFGTVWRGSDVSTGATYAVKLLRSEPARSPSAKATLVRERTALLRLRHPHVVVLHDIIVEGDQLALVMDYVDGGDLDDLRRRRGGTVPAAEATALTAQVCAALAAAHAAGIGHDDLKPSNVLLDFGEVRLTDFGLARITGGPAAAAVSAVPAVPVAEGLADEASGYRAPEVIDGARSSAAGDVYAVGVMLAELLTGERPGGRPEPAEPRPAGVSEALWSLISACLDPDPVRRPGASEVAAGLLGSGGVDPASAEAAPVAAGREDAASAGAGPAGAASADAVSADAVSAGAVSAGPGRGGAGRAAGWATAGRSDPWADNRRDQPASAGSGLSPAGDGSGEAGGFDGFDRFDADMTGGLGTPSGAGVHGGAGETGAGTGGAGGAGAGIGAAGAAGAAGPPPAPRSRPPARRSRRLAWAGGVLAIIAVAGVLAAALDRSPAVSVASVNPGAGTVTVSASAAGPAGGVVGPVPGGHRSPTGSAQASGKPSPSATRPRATSTKRSHGRPAASPGRSASLSPSPSVKATAKSSPGSSPGSPAPTRSATPTASPSAAPSPSPSPSASASPSPVIPANTAWQCGPPEPATVKKSGAATGQRLRACIRIDNGRLGLRGILTGTRLAWNEQIDLQLTDSGGGDDGEYLSLACVTAYCAYTVSVPAPSAGEWTVVPSWERHGNYQSTGDAAEFVDF